MGKNSSLNLEPLVFRHDMPLAGYDRLINCRFRIKWAIFARKTVLGLFKCNRLCEASDLVDKILSRYYWFKRYSGPCLIYHSLTSAKPDVVIKFNYELYF